MQMPGYPSGVRSPFEVHVHPWPTRYHGPIYTRPEFHFPFVQNPQAVFKPDDFSAYYTARGVGELSQSSYVTIALLGGISLGAAIMYLRMRKASR